MEKMNGLDLFTGIGGITAALSEWVHPVAYCEIERYCQAVLFSRMSEGKLPVAPIWDDIKTLNRECFEGKLDIIYGGFPCQDLSYAGRRKGLEGERSGLFYEVIRLVKEFSPSFVFLENVPGIRTKGLGEVLKEFAEAGYDCRYGFLSAEDMGAHHKRERWFLLAHSRRSGFQRLHEKVGKEYLQSASNDPWVSGDKQKWLPEPDLVRVANGIPFRMDRTKALGNSVVPSQVREAFKRLIGF